MMNRRLSHLLVALALAALWLLAPQIAYADNCSSLNDCYYTLRAALAAAVGLGVFAALMAVGLDIGPLAASARKRMKDGAGLEGAPIDGADEWERSLGMVSVEGLAPNQMGQQAAPPGGEARGSTQSEAPGARAAEEPQAMRQARKDSGAPEARGTDGGRGQPGEAQAEAGRSGEWSGEPRERTSAGVDSGDVGDRAREVAEAFDEPEGMAQTEAPPRASTQAEAPVESGPDELAGEGMKQAEHEPRAMGQQSTKVSDTGSAPQTAGEATIDSPAASSQASAPPEGDWRSPGEATAVDPVAESVLEAATEPAERATEAVEALVASYGDLGQIPGVRSLLQQAAVNGAWAARGALAHVDIVRGLREEPGARDLQAARLADVVEGRAGADIVRADGAIVEVKHYYWPGPYFQQQKNVVEATRRLVRQVELLRRRYGGREIAVAFSDRTGMPQELAVVLRSIGVPILEGVDAPPRVRAVADEAFVERIGGMTVEGYGRALLRAGWEDTSAAMGRRLRAAFEHDRRSAWLALAVYAFDAETIFETSEHGESYAAQIEQLAEHSGGALQPDSIVERIEGDALLVTFNNGGRQYARRVAAESDYFDAAVLALVNEALADQGEARRFLPLPSPDQLLYLAFAREEIIQRLTAAGLIPEVAPSELGL